jgi:hypothetical protein
MQLHHILAYLPNILPVEENFYKKNTYPFKQRHFETQSRLRGHEGDKGVQ